MVVANLLLLLKQLHEYQAFHIHVIWVHKSTDMWNWFYTLDIPLGLSGLWH